MYQFVNVNEQPSISNELPLEAMSFGGKFFENEIEGYETMSVSGRELLSKRIYSGSIDGLDGELFQGSNYEPRILKVKYMLKAKTVEEFRSNFNKLNYLLSGEQKTIYFNDELNYQFIGTVSSVDDVPEGVLDVVSSFEIFCSNPFKLKTVSIISGVGSASITNELLYPSLPEEIEVIPTVLTNRIVITNVTQNKVLAIKDTFAANVPIYIYPKTQMIIRNNTKYPNFLEWTSDFENFFLNKNDQITVVPSTVNIQIKLRERMI